VMPRNARIIVPTPGKAVPLSDYSLPVKTVTVSALAGNTTAVAIGGASVRARAGEMNGLPMSGGTRPDMWTWTDVDLGTIWVDAITANEGVSYLAWP
jgi:hypothetical protein